jgi:hypothetical protein
LSLVAGWSDVAVISIRTEKPSAHDTNVTRTPVY